MHAARNEVITCTFRRRFREHRRLDFPEPVFVEVTADGNRHAVPEADVLLQPRPPEVEVAVPQAHVLGDGRVVSDLKGWGLRFVEHADFPCEHLDLAGRELRVDGLVGPALHHAANADDVFGPEALGHRHQGVVVANHELRDARAVAQIDERDPAEIADSMDPAEQHDVRADVFGAQRSAGVCSSEVA